MQKWIRGLAPGTNYLNVYITTSVCDVFIAQHRVQFLEGLHTEVCRLVEGMLQE